MVNSQVSRWARSTAARRRGWSSSSVARARCWPRFWVLCCMAARIRAFSRFGTRPKRTAAIGKRTHSVSFRPCKRCLNLNLSIKLWAPSITHFTALRSRCNVQLLSCCHAGSATSSPLPYLQPFEVGQCLSCLCVSVFLQSVSLRCSVFSPLLHFLFF